LSGLRRLPCLALPTSSIRASRPSFKAALRESCCFGGWSRFRGRGLPRSKIGLCQPPAGMTAALGRKGSRITGWGACCFTLDRHQSYHQVCRWCRMAIDCRRGIGGYDGRR
jgi:hypothetical protein